MAFLLGRRAFALATDERARSPHRTLLHCAPLRGVHALAAAFSVNALTIPPATFGEAKLLARLADAGITLGISLFVVTALFERAPVTISVAETSAKCTIPSALLA